MTARFLHLSDLHMGHSEAWEPLEALRALITDLQPELLVATGDMAHRGRRSELEIAAKLLRALELPLFVVPGNHDIPYTFPARFTRTFDEWERVFGPTEPLHVSDHIVVVGLNSVRAWRQQGGAVDDDRLALGTQRLQEGPPDALRVVALHHHLAAPPWRVARKLPLSRRDDVLRALVAAGAELVIGGHVHQAGIAERREFKVLEEGPRRSLVLATSAALGRPRPERKEEARGLNVYDADAATITVRTFSWDGTGFLQVGERQFSRR
ncbi:MAG TPA: metallophosphoesterase [Gaiellaceae bacterium]